MSREPLALARCLGFPEPGWPAGGTERRGLYLWRSEVAADSNREAWAEAAPVGPERAGWRRVCTHLGVSWLWGAQELDFSGFQAPHL